MPSLKEIKTRIASVQNTRKITSAMKMVASSKLHHAQVAIQNMLPYETQLEQMLKSFLVTQPDATTALASRHATMRSVALVVFSSNSSLCGGFNSNAIREMQEAVASYRAAGVDRITVHAIGRKAAEAAQRLKVEMGKDYTHLAEHPNAAACATLSHELIQQYEAGEVDRVELIYHHFKSAGSQILTRRAFLPIDLSEESLSAFQERDLSSNVATAQAMEYLRKRGERKGKVAEQAVPLRDDFIVEPDLASVLQSLVPRLLNLMIYTALLDSLASEHAARMVAMQTATDNADELLRGLNLEYNKSRQGAITSELLDIVAGTVNN